jgi:hypothetical protein
LKVAAANRLDRRTMFKKWKRIWIMAGAIAVVAVLVVCLHPKLSSPVNGNGTTEIIYINKQADYTIDTSFAIYEKTVLSVYPGWTGTVPFLLSCGRDNDRFFVLSVMSPSNITNGFEALPMQCFSWIAIPKLGVNVSAGKYIEVPITVTIPRDTKYRGMKAEVWILVEDTTQTGLIQIALESRWFIIIG